MPNVTLSNSVTKVKVWIKSPFVQRCKKWAFFAARNAYIIAAFSVTSILFLSASLHAILSINEGAYRNIGAAFVGLVGVVYFGRILYLEFEKENKKSD